MTADRQDIVERLRDDELDELERQICAVAASEYVPYSPGQLYRDAGIAITSLRAERDTLRAELAATKLRDQETLATCQHWIAEYYREREEREVLSGKLDAMDAEILRLRKHVEDAAREARCRSGGY